MLELRDSDLALACAASYRRLPTYKASDCFTIRLNDIPGTLTLAFRGSISFRDWMRELDTIIEDTPIGLVHKGFRTDSYALYIEHIRHIPRCPSILTGHSKGASEAAMVAAQMVYDGWPPPKLVLFGCPRFTLIPELTVKYLEDCKIFSYCHSEDPVPLIPLGLQHPFDMIELPKNNKNLNFLEKVEGEGDIFADHRIMGYHSSLVAIGK